MAATINQQRKTWQQISNLEHEWEREYSISKSLISLATQNAISKSISFIVDWQLRESNQDAVQLNLFFKE